MKNFELNAQDSFRKSLTLEEEAALQRSALLLESFERSGSENDNPANVITKAEGEAKQNSGSKKEDDINQANYVRLFF